jgi:hypothetical protein
MSLRFLWWSWRLLSCGTWCHLVWWIDISILKEDLSPLQGKQGICGKTQLLRTRSHIITFQKIVIVTLELFFFPNVNMNSCVWFYKFKFSWLPKLSISGYKLCTMMDEKQSVGGYICLWRFGAVWGNSKSCGLVIVVWGCPQNSISSNIRISDTKPSCNYWNMHVKFIT